MNTQGTQSSALYSLLSRALASGVASKALMGSLPPHHRRQSHHTGRPWVLVSFILVLSIAGFLTYVWQYPVTTDMLLEASPSLHQVPRLLIDLMQTKGLLRGYKAPPQPILESKTGVYRLLKPVMLDTIYCMQMISGWILYKREREKSPCLSSSPA